MHFISRLLVSSVFRVYNNMVFEQQEEDVMQQLFGHSITYRIAMGPHQGRKVFRLQTLPPLAGGDDSGQAAKVAGFPCTRA